MFLVYFMTAIDRTILIVLVEPIKADLGLTDSQVGIIAGPAFAVCFTLFGIPLGMLADRTNRRNLIACCIFLWSAMTAFCGTAQSYAQMILGRAGVGIGESGGAPASVAIISDIFPLEQRARALSVFHTGSAVAVLVAFGLGSWAAAEYGWRVAFYAAAVPGIVLSILLLITIREPVRGLADGRVSKERPPPILETIRFIWQRRTIFHIMVSCIFHAATGFGFVTFLASYLVRSHDMTLADVGGKIAIVLGVGGILGQLMNGVLADFMGRFDARWRLRLPAIMSVFCIIGMCGTVLAGPISWAFAFLFLWTLAFPALAAPTYAVMQTIARPRMRATISSIQFVVLSAIGSAIGPMIVGLASDWLQPKHGSDSLRYAIVALSMLYAWGIVHFLLAARSVRADLAHTDA